MGPEGQESMMAEQTHSGGNKELIAHKQETEEANLKGYLSLKLRGFLHKVIHPNPS